MINPIKQFTTERGMWYNFFVKKFTALTTALFTAIGSLFGASAVCFAADDAADETEIYPVSFTAPLPFENVIDYAVGEGSVAYAENGDVYVHEGENLAIYSTGKNISALDYADGTYYINGGNENFSLPHKSGANGKVENFELTPAQHAFSFPEYISVGSGSYHLFKSGTLRYYLNNDESAEADVEGADGGFRKLKQYGGKAYSMSGNALYALEGATAEKVKSTYSDFSATESIPVGNVGETLKSVRGQIEFVTLKNGYYTRVDISDERFGDYFVLADKPETATVKSNGETALLLCETGNAALVSVDDKVYVTAEENCVPARNDASQPVSRKEFVKIPCAVYSVPYVSESAKLATLEANAKVNVVATVAYENVLEYEFCEIELVGENGEKTGTGYVMSGFLSPYGFDDGNDPTEFPDPNYSEEDEIKTVVIVLVVIALALTAAAYMFFVVFRGKPKKKDKDK